MGQLTAERIRKFDLLNLRGRGGRGRSSKLHKEIIQRSENVATSTLVNEKRDFPQHLSRPCQICCSSLKSKELCFLLRLSLQPHCELLAASSQAASFISTCCCDKQPTHARQKPTCSESKGQRQSLISPLSAFPPLVIAAVFFFLFFFILNLRRGRMQETRSRLFRLLSVPRRCEVFT